MPAWNSKSCTMDTVTEAFEAMGEFFEVIGHHHIMATRVGDFVVIECPDGHAHVYTLIDPEERYFLTAERVRGVVVATPIEIEAQGTTLSVHRIRR